MENKKRNEGLIEELKRLETENLKLEAENLHLKMQPLNKTRSLRKPIIQDYYRKAIVIHQNDLQIKKDNSIKDIKFYTACKIVYEDNTEAIIKLMEENSNAKDYKDLDTSFNRFYENAKKFFQIRNPDMKIQRIDLDHNQIKAIHKK